MPRASTLGRPTRRAALLLCAFALLATASCEGERSTPAPTAEPAPSGERVEWVVAPSGEDVATIVGRELSRAREDGKDLVVYVGASWCEPCQRFHKAAEEGEIDAVFPRLRVLEFDLDRDRDRLAAAGYASRMIPLFVAPNEDGTASARRFEGSVKGDAAVMDIAGRLRRILPRASAGPKE